MITLKLVASSLCVLRAQMAVGEVGHGVVPARAVLPREAVARVAVAVALAPPARASLPAGGEEARLAPLAARADGVAAAVDAHGLVLRRPQSRRRPSTLL